MLLSLVRKTRIPGYIYKLSFFLYKTFNFERQKSDRPIAFLNFGPRLLTQSKGRFAFIFCKYLEYAGYTVVVKTNLSFYFSLTRYKKLLLKEKYRFVHTLKNPENTIVLKYKDKAQIIQLDCSLGIVNDREYDYRVQFPMHPFQVMNFHLGEIVQLRKSERKIHILFSGNISKEKYSADSLESDFHVIPRYQCINYLIQNFSGSGILEVIKDQSQLVDLVNSGTNSSKMIISPLKSHETKWLGFLSSSHFFIAPPGVSHPWCHNSIEAMGVGTIPILQYSNLFSPALEHLKNCLYFSTLDELIDVINLALQMKIEDIEKIRKNVIAYYDEYLSPLNFKNKIKEFSESTAHSMNIVIPFLKP